MNIVEVAEATEDDVCEGKASCKKSPGGNEDETEKNPDTVVKNPPNLPAKNPTTKNTPNKPGYGNKPKNVASNGEGNTKEQLESPSPVYSPQDPYQKEYQDRINEAKRSAGLSQNSDVRVTLGSDYFVVNPKVEGRSNAKFAELPRFDSFAKKDFEVSSNYRDKKLFGPLSLGLKEDDTSSGRSDSPDRSVNRPSNASPGIGGSQSRRNAIKAARAKKANPRYYGQIRDNLGGSQYYGATGSSLSQRQRRVVGSQRRARANSRGSQRGERLITPEELMAQMGSQGYSSLIYKGELILFGKASLAYETQKKRGLVFLEGQD